MCRLFGLTAGEARVRATFWLLDAPDSLAAQSHRNADGSGIGFFDPGRRPVLDKQPEPAFSDQEFIHTAKQAESTTFVAHVRWATAGGRAVANTHPFAMHGRIMAHNGGFGDMARLDEKLGSYARLVLGDTDSERYFALMTQQIDAHGGDVGAGMAAAAQWIGANLPVSSLNAVVAAPGELWALRYPDTRALHVLERPAGASAPDPLAGRASTPGPPSGRTNTPRGASPGNGTDTAARDGTRTALRGGSGTGARDGAGSAAGDGAVAAAPRRAGAAGGPDNGAAGLHVRSATSSVHARALHSTASVVVASERLDGESGWRMLASGELVHVRSDLTVESAVVIPEPPRRLMPLGGQNPNIDT